MWWDIGVPCNTNKATGVGLPRGMETGDIGQDQAERRLGSYCLWAGHRGPVPTHSEWPVSLPEFPAEQPSLTQPRVSFSGIGFLTLSMGSLGCPVLLCFFSACPGPSELARWWVLVLSSRLRLCPWPLHSISRFKNEKQGLYIYSINGNNTFLYFDPFWKVSDISVLAKTVVIVYIKKMFSVWLGSVKYLVSIILFNLHDSSLRKIWLWTPCIDEETEELRI